MIKDNIKNLKCYFGLSENIKKGLEWIVNNDLSDLPDGRYELGNNNYANLQSYETKDDAPFEAHRKYIDIQYMVNGEEKCEICDYSRTKTIEEYNPQKDIEFLDAEADDYISLKTGEFAIFFPQDAHKPALNLNEKKFVKKVIVKIYI